jgi:hypothetical protein
MKVWGMHIQARTPVHGHGQRRVIVAAKTKTAAARAFGESAYSFNLYGGETGNANEIAIAMSEPGSVFVFDGDVSGGYRSPEGWHRLVDCQVTP